MKLNFKNVFLSVGIFAFALGMFSLVSVNTTEAANTCTAITGVGNFDWNTAANWTACGNTVPQPADAVVIPSAFPLTMSGDASVASISISNPATVANGIALNGHTLTVGAGGVTIVGSNNSASSTIAVGTGTLTTTGNINIVGGSSTGDSILNVSTGNIYVATIVMSSVADRAQLTSTGASNIYISGGITGGTLNDAGGTITFTGAGAHNPGNYATGYNNVAITGGTVTMAAGPGATTIGGTLTITSGTLATVDNALTVTGATSITGTITFTTGAKVFTGAVTLNSGAVWNETGASTFTIGNLVNNATTFTSSTGLHTFNKSGGTGSISGSKTTGSATTPITINTGGYNNTGIISASTLTVTSVGLSNAGTITAATSLTGAGGVLTQAPTGVLNIGGTITTITLDASSYAGNTVNYNGDADQTAADINYSNLGLSSTDAYAKTIPVTTTIGQTLTLGGLAKITLSDSSTLANKLYFGALYQKKGTWGALLATGATNKTNTYFTTGNTNFMTVTLGHTTTVQQDGTTVTTCGSGYTLVSGVCTIPTGTITVTTTTTTEPAGGCSAGNLFNTSTGNACVNNPAVPEGCGGGKLFSPVSGVACPVSSSTTVTTTTTTTTYNFGTVTLKNGSKGEAVKELQRFLNAKLALGLVIDGSLGPKTIAVIKKWQKDNGLVSDGLVGAKTKAMMNK